MPATIVSCILPRSRGRWRVAPEGGGFYCTPSPLRAARDDRKSLRSGRPFHGVSSKRIPSCSRRASACALLRCASALRVRCAALDGFLEMSGRRASLRWFDLASGGSNSGLGLSWRQTRDRDAIIGGASSPSPQSQVLCSTRRRRGRRRGTSSVPMCLGCGMLGAGGRPSASQDLRDRVSAWSPARVSHPPEQLPGAVAADPAPQGQAL